MKYEIIMLINAYSNCEIKLGDDAFAYTRVQSLRFNFRVYLWSPREQQAYQILALELHNEGQIPNAQTYRIIPTTSIPNKPRW